jgi:hypothetical protein
MDSNYGGYDSYGQSGGVLAALMRYSDLLLPLGLFLVLIVFGPRMLRAFRRGVSGDSSETLMPSGDPMRYALASAVLKGSLFRRRIIDMAQNPFLSSAPELGLNSALLVNACKRMESADRRWQWAIVALFVLPVFIPTLLSSFGFYSLAQSLALLTVPSYLGLIGLAIFRRWQARFQDVRPFRANEYDPAVVRERFGEATGVEAGFDDHLSNVVVYGETDPFVGFGRRINAWQVAVDVGRAGISGPVSRRVSSEEVFDAVKAAVTSLGIRGLEMRDIAFVNGTESARIGDIQTDRFDSPSNRVADHVIRAWRNDPNASARVYTWIRVPTSNGEVVQNYFFRCTLRGSALLLEGYQSVLPPVAAQYREVDSIRRLGFWGLLLWGLTALAFVPLTILNGWVGVFGQVREFISNLFGGPVARERKEISLNPMYNYGARQTVRELIMADRYHLYFQQADGFQMNQAIDMQALNATSDLLKSAGIDVSSLGEQSLSILQSNVTIKTGGGALSIGGSANIGGVGSAIGRIVSRGGSQG